MIQKGDKILPCGTFTLKDGVAYHYDAGKTSQYMKRVEQGVRKIYKDYIEGSDKGNFIKFKEPLKVDEVDFPYVYVKVKNKRVAIPIGFVDKVGD